MNAFDYIAIAASAILLVVLLRQELARNNRARVGYRLAATSLIISCMAALALNANRLVTTDEARAIAWLTDGYDRDSVAAFRLANPGSAVYTSDRLVMKSSAGLGVRYLPVQMLPDSLQSVVSEIHLYGHGFTDPEFDAGIPVVFHPTEIPPGIRTIGWKNSVRLGDSYRLQGTCNNPFSSPITVMLSGFRQALDSCTIPAGQSNYPFELETIPSSFGHTSYTLTVRHGRDTIEKESVPVVTTRGTPLRILWLAASPDFEQRFLKDWLAEQGHRLVLRNLVTKGKYHTVFVNTPPRAIGNVMSTLSDSIDLVMADSESLDALSVPEAAAMARSMERSGTGLLIMADSALPQQRFYRAHFLARYTAGAAEKRTLTWRDSIRPSPALLTDGLAHLVPGEEMEVLVHDSASGPVVAYSLQGRGHLAVTTLYNTYQWKLSGQQRVYEQFWSFLLTTIARQALVKGQLALPAGIVRVHEPLTLALHATDTGKAQVNIGETWVAPRQDPGMPARWTGTYWPRDTGWHVVASPAADDQWLYVWGASSWKNVRVVEKLQATRAALASIRYPVPERKNHSSPVRGGLPERALVLVMMLCFTYLWIEKKFLSPA